MPGLRVGRNRKKPSFRKAPRHRSRLIRLANAVYVSGTVPMDSEGKTVAPNDAKAQTRAVLEAIKAVLEAAGATMADVVFNTIILKDFADYKAMNEVYVEYFPKEPPARYWVCPFCRASELVQSSATQLHLKA